MDHSFISIVAMAGWLILALSSFAAYRLSWKKGLLMALIWASIFLAVVAFISAVRA